MERLIIYLMIISVLTTLTTQAIKTLLPKITSPNVLAAGVSCVLSILVSALEITYNETTITPQIIIEIITLVYFSFLGSTVGYDKVIQSIKQIAQGRIDKDAMNGDK